ncbi:10296_t:CDS:2, partial [Dentiscutata erythropus]
MQLPEVQTPPAQIIQNTITNMPQDSYSYMPNNDALRKQISYVRKKHLPSQPQLLQDIAIPINLRQTIHGEQFLAKDIEYGEEKILIFCTASNLQHLQNANYWIVDGTFKTVVFFSIDRQNIIFSQIPKE